jgi:hypothetical protein
VEVSGGLLPQLAHRKIISARQLFNTLEVNLGYLSKFVTHPLSNITHGGTKVLVQKLAQVYPGSLGWLLGHRLPGKELFNIIEKAH